MEETRDAAQPLNANRLLSLLPPEHRDDFTLTMLESVKPVPMAFLTRLSLGYDSDALTAIAIALFEYSADGIYKSGNENAEVVRFILMAAPLLGSHAIIQQISRDKVAVRNVIPSMLMSRYSDEEFVAWSDEQAALDHVDRLRGKFLDAVTDARHEPSGVDLLWLGRNYLTALGMLDQLIERKSSDRAVIEELSCAPSHALREGIL